MKVLLFIIGMSVFLFSGVSEAVCPSGTSYQADMLSLSNAVRAKGGTCGTAKEASEGKVIQERNIR